MVYNDNHNNINFQLVSPPSSMIANQTEKCNKTKNQNEKYVMIPSQPININSDDQYSKKSTPIQESLKYYINNSLNIIKESANYLSGNYKSI